MYSPPRASTGRANGVCLTIQRYSHTPQGAAHTCSRLLIHAAGRTPVHPREPGVVRHPPHTCVMAEQCAQTCMPRRPDPD
eukprot:2822489-Prymnesium_polylepis.1